MIKVCPKCGSKSLIKVPTGIKVRMLPISHNYYMKCHSLECDYEGKKIEVDTNYGKWLRKPWYLRIFGYWRDA